MDKLIALIDGFVSGLSTPWQIGVVLGLPFAVGYGIAWAFGAPWWVCLIAGVAACLALSYLMGEGQPPSGP